MALRTTPWPHSLLVAQQYHPSNEGVVFLCVPASLPSGLCDRHMQRTFAVSWLIPAAIREGIGR